MISVIIGLIINIVVLIGSFMCTFGDIERQTTKRELIGITMLFLIYCNIRALFYILVNEGIWQTIF